MAGKKDVLLVRGEVRVVGEGGTVKVLVAMSGVGSYAGVEEGVSRQTGRSQRKEY